MPVTISKRVGKGGDNLPDDVKAVQAALNPQLPALGLAPLAVSGVADAATIAAISEFQRCVVKLANPDGRVDPGGNTLKALNAAGTPARAKVTYHDNVPESLRIVSAYAIGVIGRALDTAGFDGGVITSTLREADKQAAIMYGEASKNLDAQFQLYGPAGDEVLNVFKANRTRPKDEVVALMTAKIEALEAQGRLVSRHVVSREAYAKLNVIDIGVNSTRAVAGSGFSVAKLSAAFSALAANGTISKFIDETAKSNSCWHLEIAPK